MTDHSSEGLCENCKEMIFTLMAMKCPECMVGETNTCFKRCVDCALAKNKCSNCDAALHSFQPASFGALPPPGCEWQIGATAASIAFVNEAEEYIRYCSDQEQIIVLRRLVERLKNKEIILQNWLTIRSCLAQYS